MGIIKKGKANTTRQWEHLLRKPKTKKVYRARPQRPPTMRDLDEQREWEPWMDAPYEEAEEVPEEDI